MGERGKKGERGGDEKEDPISKGKEKGRWRIKGLGERARRKMRRKFRMGDVGRRGEEGERREEERTLKSEEIQG